MDSRKNIVKKIVMARRLSNLSKVIERTKICNEAIQNLQKQRIQLMEQIQLLTTLSVQLKSERSKWKMERSQAFWEVDCQLADEATFKNNFRMDRRLFYKLCKLLPGLEKQDTNMREAIPLEKRIAIALYALGSSAEYRTIANMFGVGKSTVCDILMSFCAEVWKNMAPIYLKNFPLTKEKIESLVQEFEAIGFPQCMGALDGCHIEIHPSIEDATDYYNYKGWYSTVLLALVDARCRFIYVSTGSPGRCNDSSIFQSSSLKRSLDECSLLTDLQKKISDVDVPVLIIGDSAFRLSDKLMKPYPFHIAQSRQQKRFNYCLSKARRVVENAFGHLKARFRRIGKGIDNALRNSNAIILACCVLHNFLSEHNDRINENWLQALESTEANRTYPEYVEVITDHQNNPERIRDAIASFLSFDDDGSGEDGHTSVGGSVETINPLVDGNSNSSGVTSIIELIS